MEPASVYNRLNRNEISKAAWSHKWSDGWRVRQNNSLRINAICGDNFSFSWLASRSNTCCSDCCCSIDIWGIALNILLQDAPFLTFRLLIIIHYSIISYMNVFFTCKPDGAECSLFTLLNQPHSFLVGKNTLVILLQLYRLYVVHTENKKSKTKKKKLKYHQERQRHSRGNRGQSRKYGSGDIYTISNEKSGKHKKRWELMFLFELIRVHWKGSPCQKQFRTSQSKCLFFKDVVEVSAAADEKLQQCFFSHEQTPFLWNHNWHIQRDW